MSRRGVAIACWMMADGDPPPVPKSRSSAPSRCNPGFSDRILSTLEYLNLRVRPAAAPRGTGAAVHSRTPVERTTN
eukprot:4128915-Prymnesium_polylepis.1